MRGEAIPGIATQNPKRADVGRESGRVTPSPQGSFYLVQPKAKKFRSRFARKCIVSTQTFHGANLASPFLSVYGEWVGRVRSIR